MKFLFFTPAASSSAIGRVTQLVGRELMASAHTVTIVRTEDYALLGTPPHQFGTKMVRWDDTEGVFRVARSADAIVYQIGDSFPFHRGCLEWLPSLPGTVCLHDYFLGDLFRGWAGARWTVAQTILQVVLWRRDRSVLFCLRQPDGLHRGNAREGSPDRMGRCDGDGGHHPFELGYPAGLALMPRPGGGSSACVRQTHGQSGDRIWLYLRAG